MAVAEFPMPSVSGSNPRPIVFYKLEDEYQVTSTEYDDGGQDFALQAGGAGIQSWAFNYGGSLSIAEAAILDAHVNSSGYNSQKGSAYTFNFRDRDTGILYSNVRYAPGGYERVAHVKRNMQDRNIKLVKYP